MSSDLYVYDIQDSLLRDKCFSLFKKYLHRVRYSRTEVFSDIKITTRLL